MARILTILAALLSLTVCAGAQTKLLTPKEMRALLGNDDDKSKSDKWSETAAKFSVTHPLVDDSLLVSKTTIEAPGRDKAAIFNDLLNFFKTFYSTKECVLGFHDKDLGIINATAMTESVASEYAVFYGMDIALNYILKAQVADGKVDLTYTLSQLTSAQAKGLVVQLKSWPLNKVYPYDASVGTHKRITSKALMTSEVLRDFLFDAIEKCAKAGIIPPVKGKKKK